MIIYSSFFFQSTKTYYEICIFVQNVIDGLITVLDESPMLLIIPEADFLHLTFFYNVESRLTNVTSLFSLFNSKANLASLRLVTLPLTYLF